MYDTRRHYPHSAAIVVCIKRAWRNCTNWRKYSVAMQAMRKGRATMNRDDIIRMAREAGVAGVTVWSEEEQADVLHPDLEHFAALVAAAEREACAKVCEAEGERVDASWVSCAFAIRERGAP